MGGKGDGAECTRPIPEIRDQMREVDLSKFDCEARSGKEREEAIVLQPELTFRIRDSSGMVSTGSGGTVSFWVCRSGYACRSKRVGDQASRKSWKRQGLELNAAGAYFCAVDWCYGASFIPLGCISSFDWIRN